jgi:hypothetical protein
MYGPDDCTIDRLIMRTQFLFSTTYTHMYKKALPTTVRGSERALIAAVEGFHAINNATLVVLRLQ